MSGPESLPTAPSWFRLEAIVPKGTTERVADVTARLTAWYDQLVEILGDVSEVSDLVHIAVGAAIDESPEGGALYAYDLTGFQRLTELVLLISYDMTEAIGVDGYYDARLATEIRGRLFGSVAA